MSELATISFWQRGTVVGARVAGEIDLANATDLQRDIAAVVSNDATGLVLDLSGLTFMDSSGIHMLFGLNERLRVRAQRLAVVLPRGNPARRVLDLSGPEPAAWVHETEAAAIAAVEP